VRGNKHEETHCSMQMIGNGEKLYILMYYYYYLLLNKYQIVYATRKFFLMELCGLEL